MTACRKPPLTTPGVDDYFTLTRKHGRPFGPFEPGRILPYQGFTAEPLEQDANRADLAALYDHKG